MIYQIKNMFCVLPYFKSDEMNEFIYTSFLWSRNSGMKLAKARPRWLCVASPSRLQVTSTFQRNLNFHTPVVLLAQLEGPAWPFSLCPVGIHFDIGGDPWAEWENRMRSWLQGNIWSQSWVRVRADTACEDSFLPTEAISLLQADCSQTQAFTLAKPWMTVCVPAMSTLVSLELQTIRGQVCFLKQEALSGSVFRLPAENITENRHPVEQTQNLIQPLTP